MEELKPLEELTDPDPRNESWILLAADPPGRQMTVADQHEQMRELALPDSVPETVRSEFAITRTLWLYGWFYWPFYTLAGLHAHLTVEMGLHQRCEREGVYEELGLKRKNAGLKRLFEEALRRRWITDEDFERFREVRNARRQAGEEEFVWPKPEEVTREIPEDQHYSYLIREFTSYLRNAWAHPDHHSHWGFGQSYDELKIAHGILTTLFPS